MHLLSLFLAIIVAFHVDPVDKVVADAVREVLRSAVVVELPVLDLLAAYLRGHLLQVVEHLGELAAL